MSGRIEVDSGGILLLCRPAPPDEATRDALNRLLHDGTEDDAVTRWLASGDGALLLGGRGSFAWRYDDAPIGATAAIDLPGPTVLLGDAWPESGFGPLRHEGGALRVHWVPAGTDDVFASLVLERISDAGPTVRIVTPPDAGDWQPAIGKAARVRSVDGQLMFMTGPMTCTGAVVIERPPPSKVAGFTVIDPTAGRVPDGTKVRIVGQRGHVWVVRPI